MTVLDDKSTIVASGSSYGALPRDQHARLAVQAAMGKMRPDTVGSVLLFLTSGYAHKPQMAIKEAVKAAGTPQVSGCCAMGLLTEQEWLLDVEGAVAMVFPRDFGIQPWSVARQSGMTPSWSLTLSSPNASSMAVNAISEPQFGALSSDEFGHGPFSLWQSGRIVEREFTHTALPVNCEYIIGKAEGIRRISPVMQINRAKGHNLLELNQQSAVDNVLAHLPENLHSLGLQQPINLVAAISENTSRESIDNGHYRLLHIVSFDPQAKLVRLSGSIQAGRHLFWAMRDEQRAQQVMRSRLLQAKKQFQGLPKFALMFPDLSRGAAFYNGRDRDLELFQEVFPGLPMIGFYGHGEIAPGHRLAGLIHHFSTVFGIFG